MALIIGPDQPYLPKKTGKYARDQLMQIADWIYSQTDVALDLPEQGCSQKITLYTPKFNSNGGWELSDNIFSWQKDSEHTEEWSVWIISSRNDSWHDYGELDSEATYNFEYIVPEGHHQSIFGFVSHSSTRSNGQKDNTYGNLLDNISFKEYYYIDVNNATNNGNAQQGTTQTDNNSFMIEPEPQTDQPATQDSQGFEISTDVYDTNANGNAAGSQTQQGNAQTDVMTDAVEPQKQPEQPQQTKQPVPAVPQKEEPAANDTDELIFDFGDDTGTGNSNANSSTNNNNGNDSNNKQNGYDLEDEYYDLDGF